MVPSDTFHLISIVSDDPATLEPAAAYTLEEAGPIVTQGDDYTEVVGDEDGCVVAPKAYTKEKNPMYLYL